MQTNFNEIAKTINDNMRAKGFWDKERNLGEALMLVNTELCEGLEAVRGGKYSKMGEYLQGAVMIDEGQAPVEVKNQKKVLLFETTVKDTFEDEIADAFIALMDLIQLRDCYCDGWKPDWSEGSVKYSIVNYNGKIDMKENISNSRLLSFPTPNLRNKFFSNFRDLIKTAIELI